MAILLRQPDLGRAAYTRLVESNKDNECYILGLLACDEDEQIRKLFALPCCSLNNAVGRADSKDYLKNLCVLTLPEKPEPYVGAGVCYLEFYSLHL